MAWWPLNISKLRTALRTLSALVQTLLERIRHLEHQIQTLQQRVQELSGRLAQNSQNSHRPPSSDGPAKPAPKSLRRKSGRRPGGQPGHVGRTLEPVAQPDHVIPYLVGDCPGCGASAAQLAGQPVLGYERRQVFDLPPIRLEVTEHRAEIKTCPCCGKAVRAVLPSTLKAPAQYGPRMNGLFVYWHQEQLIPPHRVAQMCEDLLGQPCSPATVLAAERRVYVNLAVFERRVIELLQQARVAHADETGMWVARQLYWLHVVSTADLTFYGVHKRRGAEGMRELGVLPGCHQWLIHDCLASYFTFTDCLHGLCNAHLLRELAFLAEQCGEGWAARLSEFLLAQHQRVQRQGVLGEGAFKRVLAQYQEILAEGRAKHPRPAPGSGKKKQSKAANLLGRLEDYDQSFLAHLWAEEVPFTNNQGERDLRMMKVQQKIAGCFRTLWGARIFARNRSYLSTCRKQGLNLWEALLRAVRGDPFLSEAPALGPP